MCAITISLGFTSHKTFHIIFHIWPIPDISIIFCRRGSVGAGVPRGFCQLIKVLRKETGQAIRGPVGAQQQLHSSTGRHCLEQSFRPIFGFGLKAPSNRWTAGRIPCFAGVRPKRCGRPSAGKKRPEPVSQSQSWPRKKSVFPERLLAGGRQGSSGARSNSCN